MNSASTVYAVTNPATGHISQSYPTASDADIAEALTSASLDGCAWARTTTVAQRAALIGEVARLYDKRCEELAALIVAEIGKSAAEARAEVSFTASIYRYYAANAAELLADRPIPLSEAEEGNAIVRKSPYGVLLGIMPWNFPYYQVARFVAPNLCVGNPILLKHAPQCPSSAALIAEIFEEAGFPPGAYTNLYATNDQIGTLIADPRIAGVSLTGSERAGSAVAEIAGRHLKKVVLELGGSDAFVLLSTRDLDAAVASAVAARMDNTGQTCNAAKRFIIADDLYDAFTEKLLAAIDERVATTRPLLSSSQAAVHLRNQVEAAQAHGAVFVAYGSWEGAYVPAGVLTDVTPANPAFHQEFFGPIAMVFRCAGESEAIALANDSPYGLGAYVFTTDPAQAQRVADALHVGMVFVNGVGLESAGLPFGGIKRSGYGRELGHLGIDEFVNQKVIRTTAWPRY